MICLTWHGCVVVVVMLYHVVIFVITIIICLFDVGVLNIVVFVVHGARVIPIEHMEI